MQQIGLATLLLGLALAAPRLDAQSASSAVPDSVPPAADSVFLRARRLVSEGNGAAGRALVDSVLGTTAPTAPEYPEALFWRASLATSSADAERDYRRLAVEFPLSTRSEDALLRLAQMELARGDRAMAVKHLERLTLEHPTGASRPQASYWMARILFESNDVQGACAAIAGARATAPANDIELRNQIEYTARRCARYDAQRAADSAAAFAADTTGGATGVRTPGAVATASAPVPAPTTVSAAAPAAARPSATHPAPTPSAATRPAPASRPARAAAWAVQVAAFDTKAPAESLARKLARGGVQAHVAGTSAPFRVRVGHYTTRAAAVKEQQRLRARRITGFVVEEE